MPLLSLRLRPTAPVSFLSCFALRRCQPFGIDSSVFDCCEPAVAFAAAGVLSSLPPPRARNATATIATRATAPVMRGRCLRIFSGLQGSPGGSVVGAGLCLGALDDVVLDV